MIAVDPAPGVGGHGLTGVATGWLRRSGLLVAVIEAGCPGHAPGWRVCEEASYTVLPAARFFRASGSRRRLTVTGLRFRRGRWRC